MRKEYIYKLVVNIHSSNADLCLNAMRVHFEVFAKIYSCDCSRTVTDNKKAFQYVLLRNAQFIQVVRDRVSLFTKILIPLANPDIDLDRNSLAQISHYNKEL